MIPRLSHLAMQLHVSLKAMFNPVSFGVAGLVEDAAGRVLLVRHSYQPGWHLPGGGVGRGEPPADAIRRELQEEVGFVRGDGPEFVGIFTRRMGWATNVIALYRVVNAEIAFKPNFEIREITFADPANPPDGTTPATRRRLAERLGRSPRGSYW